MCSGIAGSDWNIGAWREAKGELTCRRSASFRQEPRHVSGLRLQLTGFGFLETGFRLEMARCQCSRACLRRSERTVLALTPWV